ncbi:MAG TPA: amidohydrolase family protein [Chitinophagales bacterium]|nr:amidohydrolase family protein [Chitinophagales bacterium]
MKPQAAVLLLFLTVLITTKLLQAQTPDTTFYSVVKGKSICGVQKKWTRGMNEYHYFYQYNDRGRGESIYDDVVTDDRGWVVKSFSHGLDYYKKPYHSSFEVKGDSAISIENDEKKTKLYKHEFYTGMQAPGSIELMINAAELNVPELKISIFSGDSVEVRALHRKTLLFQNQSLPLVLAEIYYGKNTPPNFVWLSSYGQFFASVSDWFSTILKGYESLTDTLNSIQEAQSLSYYTKQMSVLSNPIPSKFAVTNVRVYDSERAAMLENMTVMVTDGIVTEVAPSAEIRISSDYKIIDGTNKTLLPGLWDMHGHYYKGEGLNYLAGGVTHVRDMGNSNSLPDVRDAIRRNEVLGPDLSYVSGFIDQAGPYQGPTGAIVNNLQEGITAVDDFAKRGYGQIKLYSSIDPKWVKPLADEAHAKGMRVAGHIPSFMTAANAVKDGYNEITHMNMVMLNFMSDTIDTRTPGRFSVVGERAKNIDVNGKEVAAFIQLLKEKKISLDPTMNVFYEMFEVFSGDTDASYKPVLKWMPVEERGNVAATSGFAPDDQKATYTASFNNMMVMLKKIYDNGILIVSGTDGGESFALEHELELYVQAGIPPLNALQTATYNAAKDCNLQNQFGSITVGKQADLILIDGNPGTNISDIRRVQWVIKNNRQYDPKKLFASIGWSYYY